MAIERLEAYKQYLRPVLVEQPPSQNKGVSCFVFGDMGSWKTTWAAGWPGPAFISIRSEGGDRSLGEFPSVAEHLCNLSKMDCPPVFNVKQPLIFPVRTPAEFEQYVREICLHYKEWGICTVIVDSISTLIDCWIDELMRVRKVHGRSDKFKQQIKERGGEFMGPAEWQLCNHFLRSPRVKLGNLGLNNIWIALEKKVFKSNNKDNMMERKLDAVIPFMAGESMVKLPASLDLHIHAERRVVMNPDNPMISTTQPTYWTAPHGQVELNRHRFGFRFKEGKLMDPEWGDYPTFRAVWQELNEYIYVGQ